MSSFVDLLESEYKLDVYKQVKCCRRKCSHIHLESDRVAGAPWRDGSTPMLCPKCLHDEYYIIDNSGR